MYQISWIQENSKNGLGTINDNFSGPTKEGVEKTFELLPSLSLSSIEKPGLNRFAAQQGGRSPRNENNAGLGPKINKCMLMLEIG
jgi:hypothetical protein